MIPDFITSDWHLGHKNIIKYSNRPFKDVDEMNRELVKRYNDVVWSPNHVVLWLGDCAFNYRLLADTISNLNGIKILLRGNHDKDFSDSQLIKAGFSVVLSQHFMSRIGNTLVRYSHYPYKGYSEDRRYEDRRPPKEKGVILIHGHTHEPYILTPKNTIHAGVDGYGYYPIPINVIKDKLPTV